MFCIKCGKKIQYDEKFCTSCGASIITDKNSETKSSAEKEDQYSSSKSESTWWKRLLFVTYIVAHLPLLIVVPVVWMENSRRYSSYSNSYYGSDGEAFWYVILTIFFWLLTLRLLKIALKYIANGIKPKLKDLLYFY
jgi:hypothetical protein